MAAYAALTPSEIRQELSRLEGHQVVVSADRSSYRIINVAAEGPAMIGIIEARGNQRWFIRIDEHAQHAQHAQQQWQLRGRLAIPRIAGPGYKVWVVGEIRAGELWARRLGILRSPHRRNAKIAKIARATLCKSTD